MARLLYYGPLSDMAENGDVALPDAVRDTGALVDWLAAEDAALGEALRSRRVRIIVNDVVATGAHPVTDADEIGFLPPFSGG
ncbi:MAG: MoaD/ThiS family protein [Pseudomonadota bacterium]